MLDKRRRRTGLWLRGHVGSVPRVITGPLDSAPGKAHTKVAILLPLDCARWFGRDIENDAIYSSYFINDAIGDAGQ